MKRYSPKYKLILRCKQYIWEEKSKKIKKFKKAKWQGLKKNYMKFRLNFINQDSSSQWLSSNYKEKNDQGTRLKKTYRFLLIAKQRLQYYIGGGRLQRYQLKKLAHNAEKKGKISMIPSSNLFLDECEKRWALCLYHLRITRSLSQGRKLLLSKKVKSLDNDVVTPNFSVPKLHLFQFDPLKTCDLLNQFLRYRLPFYYLKRASKRRSVLFLKKEQSMNSLFVTKQKENLQSLKKKLKILRMKKKLK